MSFSDREIGEIAATVGLPPTSGYARLKAGLDFPGGYNSGLLRDEVVSGYWPNVTATAKINGGVLDGLTIDLIDTTSPSSISHFVKVA